MWPTPRAAVVLTASLLVFALPTAAHADEILKSWRFQGPAFSHHYSLDIAPIRDNEPKNDGLNRSSRTYQDYPYKDGENTSDYCARFASNLAGVGPAATAISQRVRSICLEDLQEPYIQGGKRQWNEQNLEAGVEYDIRNLTANTVQRYYLGAVVDSYFKPGLYLGGSYQATIHDGSRFRLDVGAAGLLWWRTVARSTELPKQPVKPGLFPIVSIDDQSQWVETLHRRLVPAMLPVVSIEDKSLRVGANISFVPKIRWAGITYSVNTLVVQLTWGL